MALIHPSDYKSSSKKMIHAVVVRRLICVISTIKFSFVPHDLCILSVHIYAHKNSSVYFNFMKLLMNELLSSLNHLIIYSESTFVRFTFARYLQHKLSANFD